MSTQLHPDWPEVIDGKRFWEQPHPLADVISALDFAPGEVGLSDLATVELYAIDSNDGQWSPGRTVGTEVSMTLLGTLADGRWFALEAGNDYTGWGCLGDQADLYVGDTRDDVIRNGLTTEGRNQLGLSIDGGDPS